MNKDKEIIELENKILRQIENPFGKTLSEIAQTFDTVQDFKKKVPEKELMDEFEKSINYIYDNRDTKSLEIQNETLYLKKTIRDMIEHDRKYLNKITDMRKERLQEKYKKLKYYCVKCKSNHFFYSDIGLKHRQYIPRKQLPRTREQEINYCYEQIKDKGISKKEFISMIENVEAWEIREGIELDPDQSVIELAMNTMEDIGVLNRLRDNDKYGKKSEDNESERM